MLKYVLCGIGVPVENVAESDSGSRISIYTVSARDRRRWYEKIKKLKIKNIDVDVRLLKDTDWRDKWRETESPVRLACRLNVIPVKKEKFKDSPKKGVIYLDSSYAFGTGSHPTTRMMAEFIYSRRAKFNAFFDIGTGTGILSIMASKAGARHIWSIDIDKDSVKAARYNFKINNCRVDFLKQVDFEAFKTNKKFDFIAANLLTADLIRMRHKILSRLKKGGYLSVSGILESNSRIFRKKFCDGSLRCLKVTSEGGWKAFLYKKPFD